MLNILYDMDRQGSTEYVGNDMRKPQVWMYTTKDGLITKWQHSLTAGIM
jgi:hypothetical protein